MAARRDKECIGEIWSPTDELRDSLEARIAACQAQYDKVVVYRSGRGDLVDLTAELLKKNRGIER